jgi:hypothetical protein
MRTPPFFLALAFVVSACSAESAPDNAAGSVQKAPLADPSVKPGGDEVELLDELGKKKKKKKADPTTNGPRCSSVTKDICPDSSRQKWCSCTAAFGNGGTYECGCKEETTEDKPAEFEGVF